MRFLLTLILLLLLLSACGQKGDLILPDKASDASSPNEEGEAK